MRGAPAGTRWKPARLLVPLAAMGLAACGTGATSAPTTTSVPTGVGPAASPSPSPSPPVPSSTTAPPAAAPVPADPPTTTPGPPMSSGIRIGPGTMAAYSVQPQPPAGTCRFGFVGSYPLPDPSCTPGATNPQVTQEGIGSTICRSGWTATVRPNTGVTGPEKAGSAVAYGYSGSFTTGEYDHLIPLELGGDPNDPANLWLEPNDRPGAVSFANSKDGLERALNRMVCSGGLSLAAAQMAIASDWVAALHRYVG
jgi:hypothetical protein